MVCGIMWIKDGIARGFNIHDVFEQRQEKIYSKRADESVNDSELLYWKAGK